MVVWVCLRPGECGVIPDRLAEGFANNFKLAFDTGPEKRIVPVVVKGFLRR